jgi:hypothetical protein
MNYICIQKFMNSKNRGYSSKVCVMESGMWRYDGFIQLLLKSVIMFSSQVRP